MNIAIERCTFRAWPSFEMEEEAGWVRRSAEGYTKRANSVTVIEHSAEDLPARIMAAETWYKRRRQPPIFRLLSFTQPWELDEALDRRGYERVEPTLVMAREVQEVEGADGVDWVPLDDWLPTFDSLHETDTRSSETHARILRSIPAKAGFAVRRTAGVPVACGLAVADHDYVGIYDVITAHAHRRLGHGSRVVRALEAWCAADAPRTAYLQVVKANEPAVFMYEKLGYEVRYEYWYRRGTA